MIKPDTTRSGAARFLAFALLSPVLAQLASAQNAAPASLSVQAAGTAQFPAAWQGHDASGDPDVIRSQLGNVLAAVGAGDYEQAETARLDAYATLESGPEARISVFAPDLKLRLENLFWNGPSSSTLRPVQHCGLFNTAACRTGPADP